MTFKRLVNSIAIVTLLALSLYLLIAFKLLLEPKQVTSVYQSLEVHSDQSAGASIMAITAESNSSDQLASPTGHSPGGHQLLEVFGRVLDRENRPIENALITEERYFFSARSDVAGYYRILLDMPGHRYPVLQFLHSGFSGIRIKLGKAELLQQPIHELDVRLDDAVDSVNLQGWVGNDIGVGLEMAAVKVNAVDSYYLTVFTDERGNFEFEGARG